MIGVICPLLKRTHMFPSTSKEPIGFTMFRVVKYVVGIVIKKTKNLSLLYPEVLR
jgi:hypothetical protein